MLTYDKWGTRIAVCDEPDDHLQDFVRDGAKATAEGNGWEMLPGPVERVPDGTYGGEDVVCYLWPVARPQGARD
jgi:hypothetical protein